MRHQTHTFMEKVLKDHTFTRVLEVGSGDVNGSIRDLFTDNYIGSDMRPGKNVDDVVNGHNLVEKYGKESFDCVCSFDCFEHDNAFWLTLDQMKQVLQPGGYIVLGVPSLNCPEHNHPHDYWRFIGQSMEEMLNGYEDVHIEIQRDDPAHGGDDEIYGYGRKP